MIGGEMTVLFSLTYNSLPALFRDTVPLADATLYALLKALVLDIGYEII